MAHRAFAVFQDTPTSPANDRYTFSSNAATVLHPTTCPLSPSSSSALNTSTITALATAIDKENLHPLTGERTSGIAAGQKRKSALTTKSQAPLSTKKLKDSSKEDAPPKPELKKRKSSSTSSSSKTTKTSSSSSSKKEKEGKASSSGSSKKSTKKLVRKPSSLPVVHEHGESEREGERLVNAEISSRCYDLTVRPLADVTQAYDQGVLIEQSSPSSPPKVIFRSIKESSAEPEIRDYFSPYHASTSTGSAGPTTPTRECATTFSTPERKQIYSAFTFTSPSPSGKRFGEAKAVIAEGFPSPYASPTRKALA